MCSFTELRCAYYIRNHVLKKIFMNVQSLIINIIFPDTLLYLNMTLDSDTQLECNILNCTAYYTEFVK